MYRSGLMQTGSTRDSSGGGRKDASRALTSVRPDTYAAAA